MSSFLFTPTTARWWASEPLSIAWACAMRAMGLGRPEGLDQALQRSILFGHRARLEDPCPANSLSSIRATTCGGNVARRRGFSAHVRRRRDFSQRAADPHCASRRPCRRVAVGWPTSRLASGRSLAPKEKPSGTSPRPRLLGCTAVSQRIPHVWARPRRGHCGPLLSRLPRRTCVSCCPGPCRSGVARGLARRGQGQCATASPHPAPPSVIDWGTSELDWADSVALLVEDQSADWRSRGRRYCCVLS
jgi:hypothetical protein